MTGSMRDQWVQALLLALAGSILLSLAGFYVFPSGKVNSFPTYLVVLFVLLLAALRPVSLKAVVHARAGLLAFVLLIYLVAVTIAVVGPDAAMKGVRYTILIAAFLAAVSVCVAQLPRFLPLLVRVIVLCALVSACHYLLGLLYTDSAVPWGRLRVNSVAASAYAFGAVIAFGLALSAVDSNDVRDGVSFRRQVMKSFGWGLVALILGLATWIPGETYVLLGLLTALLAVSIAFAWNQRLSRRAIYWLPVIAVLMIAQIMVFNVVMDTGRPLIWQSAVDEVFEGGRTFGAGIRVEPIPTMNCEAGEKIAGFAGCRVDHVHSIYVSTLHHGGILGFALLVLLVLLATSDVLDLPPGESRTVTLVMLAFGLTVLLFDGQTIIRKVDFIWLLFWLPVALAGALYSAARSSDQLAR